MGISWNPLEWWAKDAEYAYVGPAVQYMTSTASGPGGNISDGCTWTINTTYTQPENRVFYHPSRSGPTWKNTSQRVTRRQLSRYTKT